MDRSLPLLPSQSDLLKEYPENYNFDRMKLPASPSGTGISYKQFMLPAALIGYGAFETVMAAGKVHWGNYAVHNQVQKHVKNKITIDNYTQYIPAASVYALNILGVKGKNNFRDRTIVLGLASAFTAISVNGLKYTTQVERPDGTRKNSFPSGHTAFAFMGLSFYGRSIKMSPFCMA
ncbi:MAG: hypothetical protein LUD15_03375 [Bacteroides sp.]|nr:hypothetical protein [Bacteroides sp.]